MYFYTIFYHFISCFYSKFCINLITLLIKINWGGQNITNYRSVLLIFYLSNQRTTPVENDEPPIKSENCTSLIIKLIHSVQFALRTDRLTDRHQTKNIMTYCSWTISASNRSSNHRTSTLLIVLLCNPHLFCAYMVVVLTEHLFGGGSV